MYYVQFHHCKLLLLINLRGFLSDPEVNLKRILECYYEESAVDDIASYARKRSGLGLYFILDGLDEYVPNKGGTCISKKECLPKCVVMVASRPAAVAQLRSKATACIEVIGFLKKQIYKYIEKYDFSTESKVSQLHRYLEDHPNVLHMCYLPIHVNCHGVLSS